MSSAGQQLVAGRIPGERIATTEAVADSADFDDTPEAVLMSVDVDVVNGRTYRPRFFGKIASTAAADLVTIRLREDNLTGSIRAHGIVQVLTTSSFGYPIMLEFEFDATGTSTKTFVITGQRLAGSGQCRLEASTSGPAYLYADYISG
jgi:hypothetical protein